MRFVIVLLLWEGVRRVLVRRYLRRHHPVIRFLLLERRMIFYDLLV